MFEGSYLQITDDFKGIQSSFGDLKAQEPFFTAFAGQRNKN